LQKPGRMYPKSPQQRFKTEVEDSFMAVIAAAEPSGAFTADSVPVDKRSEFDKTIKRLCELGCRKAVIFYCLSRVKLDADDIQIPNSEFVKTLARRMEKIAQDIAKIERTGLIDPLDERELSMNMDQIIAGTNAAWFRALPNSLTRRAATYRRWAEMFADQGLRRDLLSRVNRLSLSVYVKLATIPRGSEKPVARRHLVVKLLECVGKSVDRSQIKRELEHFESMHFQAHSALEDKLQRMHDAAHC
jgi:hypothetical protein